MCIDKSMTNFKAIKIGMPSHIEYDTSGTLESHRSKDQNTKFSLSKTLLSSFLGSSPQSQPENPRRETRAY